MTDWERPYESAGPLVPGLLVSAAGLLPLCSYATTPGGYPPSGTIAIVLFMAAWQLVLWRVILVGVQTGPAGIKVRHVVRTRVVPWPAVQRVWIGPAHGYDATTIWITVSGPEGERDVETPLWRSGPRARHRNRVKLTPEEFYQVFVRLNAGRQR